MATIKPQTPIVNWGNSLTQGLVIHTPFHEGAGKTAADIASGKKGTITGAIWVKNSFGNCLSFGTSRDVSIPDNSSFTTPSITLSCFIRPTTTTLTNPTFVRRWNTAGYILRMESGVYKFYINTNANKILSSTVSCTTGVWTHLLVTYDASTGLQSMYINGVLNNSQTVAGGAITYGSTHPLYFGGFSPGGEYYDGLEDRPMIWNRALTYQEVRRLYANPWEIYKTTQLATERAEMSSPSASVSPSSSISLSQSPSASISLSPSPSASVSLSQSPSSSESASASSSISPSSSISLSQSPSSSSSLSQSPSASSSLSPSPSASQSPSSSNSPSTSPSPSPAPLEKQLILVDGHLALRLSHGFYTMI